MILGGISTDYVVVAMGVGLAVGYPIVELCIAVVVGAGVVVDYCSINLSILLLYSTISAH